LAPKHDSVEIFAKKIKMAEILGFARNPFFYRKYSKSEIFQKVLPRFIVLSVTKILQKTVFENLSKWRYNPRQRIFDFLFSKKIVKNQ
jgi:hypothetical protein